MRQVRQSLSGRMLPRLTLSKSPGPLTKQRKSEKQTVQRLSMQVVNKDFFGTRELDVVPDGEETDQQIYQQATWSAPGDTNKEMDQQRQSSEDMKRCQTAPNIAAASGRSSQPTAVTMESPPPMLRRPLQAERPLQVGKNGKRRTLMGAPLAVREPEGFDDIIKRLSEEHHREIETLKQRMVELSLLRKENSELRTKIADMKETSSDQRSRPASDGRSRKSLPVQDPSAQNSSAPPSSQGAGSDASQPRSTDQQGVSGFMNSLSSGSGSKKKGPMNQLNSLPEDEEHHEEDQFGDVQNDKDQTLKFDESEAPAIATDSETRAWEERQKQAETKSEDRACGQDSPKKERTGEGAAGDAPVDSSEGASSYESSDCRTEVEGGRSQKSVKLNSCASLQGSSSSMSMDFEGDTSAMVTGSGITRDSTRNCLSDMAKTVLDRWHADHAPFSKSPIRQQQRNVRVGGYMGLANKEHTQESLVRDYNTEHRLCSCSNLVAFPGSKYRLMWDLSGMMLIFFDIIMIPLGVFNPPENAFITFMNWVTLLFWSCDIISSFFVGYVAKGETVMQFHLILLHYFRTWFIIDAIVVGTDWVLMASKNSSSGMSDVGRSLRVLRIMRTFRLLRLFKLKRIMAELEDRINSEFVSIITNILKLILMLLMASHFIGCSWYFVGTSGLEEVDGKNWVEAQGFEDRSLGYRYSTALHWSLTQFTPASMDVQPHNAFERSFAIIILVFALVTFSSFLSSITSSMTQLRHMSEDSRKEFWMLRRYLREKGVGKKLAMRVQRYLEYAVANQRSQVPEAKVKVLSLLSEQLHNELKCAVSMPSLCVHPLMHHISKTWLITTHRLSDVAISKKLLACGDNLFYAGEDGVYMFFVLSGQLQYMKAETGRDTSLPSLQQNGQSAFQGSVCQAAFSSCVFVGETDWISEQVMWTSWQHVGDLQAVTESTMIRVDGNAFGEVICMQLEVWHFVRNYAEEFVRLLNQMKNYDVSDVLVGENLDPTTEIMETIMGGEVLQDSSDANTGKNSWLKFAKRGKTGTKNFNNRLLKKASTYVQGVRGMGRKTMPIDSGGTQIGFQGVSDLPLQSEPLSEPS